MRKLHEEIGKIEKWAAMGLLVLLSLLVFVSAVARTLHQPVAWGIDLATFLFAWCVFLSGDIALRKDMLVRIDFFVNKLPKQAQTIVYLFNQAVIIVFLAALIGYGFWLSYTTWDRTFQGIPGFSYTWVTLSVPVGALLMLFTTVLKVKETLTSKEGTA